MRHKRIFFNNKRAKQAFFSLILSKKGFSLYLSAEKETFLLHTCFSKLIKDHQPPKKLAMLKPVGIGIVNM